MRFALNEIDKSYGRPKKYEKEIPEKVKREIENHALTFRTLSAIKKIFRKVSEIYVLELLNNWKNKCRTGGDKFAFQKVGKPNLLDDHLIKKVKDIAIGSCQAGGVINRRQIVNIEKDVVRANNPDILKEFGGTVELTNQWPRSVLPDLKWSKQNGTTGKRKAAPQFLPKEKFTFQRVISTAISSHDIPNFLVLNIDQTNLSYVSLG